MDIEEIKKLYYNEKLGSVEIAQGLGKTTWQVISFMKKNHLARRSSSQTNHLQYLRKPKSYSKINNLNPEKKSLYISGLMLYWGDGAKIDYGYVDFANSNPKMAALFLSMLRNIYHIQEIKIRILIYHYDNQNYQQLQEFWSNYLKIPTNQFIKPYSKVQPITSKRKNLMKYGVVHVRYADKRLLAEILSDIDIIADELLGRDGGVV